MPVTIPVPDPTVAIAVLLLLQTPPEVESLSAVVEPTHSVVTPSIGLLVLEFMDTLLTY